MKIIIATIAICLLSWGCKKHGNSGPIITTVAGNGGDTTFPTDGAMATDCNLFTFSATADHNGSIYFVEGTAIYKITLDGHIHRFAGRQADSGYSGDNGPASEAQIGFVTDIACDNNGNLLMVDRVNERIRKVDIFGIITTVAGNGTKGFSGDNGPSTDAALNLPDAVAIDNAGNIYVSDGWNFRIRKINTNGIINTIAGTGIGGYEGDGGPATAANIYSAYGLAVDPTGGIYIENRERIREISTDGIIKTIAGNGTAGFTGDGGPATAAKIQCGGIAGPNIYSKIPSGVAVDNDGNLFFADGLHQRIRKVDKNGIITTFAGNGYYFVTPTAPFQSYRGGFSGDGGAAIAAKLSWPSDVTVDNQGNVLIADAFNNRIRKVTR